MKKRGKARPLLLAAAGVALVTYSGCGPDHVGNLRPADYPPAPQDAGPAPQDEAGTPVAPTK